MKPCVVIYRPVKTAMQAGLDKSHRWIVEFPLEQQSSRRPPQSPELRGGSPVGAMPDPAPDKVMGWYGGGDTLDQVRLSFETLESALTWARAQGFEAIVRASHNKRVTAKSYADNFAQTRPVPWTH